MLAGLSAYYLFFIIVPFFLLGIYAVPLDVLMGETVDYERAMGSTACISAFLIVLFGLGARAATVAWLFSFINFCTTRNRYVLLLLMFAALPIAYVNAGPYAEHIQEWIWGD